MYSIQRALFVPPLDLNPPIPVDTITQSPRFGMAHARESILGEIWCSQATSPNLAFRGDSLTIMKLLEYRQ